MKKFIIIFVLLFISFYTFAAVQTYSYSSPEVQTLLLLSKLTGTPLINLTYPITQHNLIKMLETIDTSVLSSSSLKIYFELKNRLTSSPKLFKSDSVTIDADIDLLLFQMIRGNDVIKYNEMKSFANFDFQIGISKYFYGVFDIDLYPKQFSDYTELGDIRLNTLYNVKFGLLSYPIKAYGSIGNKSLNLVIGRDRISAGNGVTGNLNFSENHLYDKFAKFSVYDGFLSYDFTALSFNYWDFKDNTAYLHITDLGSKSKTIINHRFSAVIPKILSISLYEGNSVFTSGLLGNLEALNPFMMIHNTFSFYSGNSNNYFGFEISYPVIPGIELNLNVIIDQLFTSGELENSGDNSYGILFNAKGAFDFDKNGILEPYIEFVYNSPQLYLKEEDNFYYGIIDDNLKEDYDNVKNWNVDLVGDNYMNSENESQFIGYPYGGDVWVISIGGKYRNWDLTLLSNISFRSKGNYGIGKNEDRTISKNHILLPRENALVFDLGVEGKLFNNVLNYKLKLSSITKWNFEHTNKTKSDFQFNVLLDIDLDALIPNIKKV